MLRPLALLFTQCPIPLTPNKIKIFSYITWHHIRIFSYLSQPIMLWCGMMSWLIVCCRSGQMLCATTVLTSIHKIRRVRCGAGAGAGAVLGLHIENGLSMWALRSLGLLSVKNMRDSSFVRPPTPRPIRPARCHRPTKRGSCAEN